jgi:NADH-quinone oxidoreductase subunit J
LFGALAGIAAMAAVGVVAFGNAVRSALCLVLNFFVLAFLYFTLSAEMLGITQIIVYTGAIMVLFLFVIMLLNLGSPGSLQEPPDYIKKGLALLFGLGLAAMIGSQVLFPLRGVTEVSSPSDYGTPQSVGHVLFTSYVWPFEMIGILLLVGVVGSILLAKRKVE